MDEVDRLYQALDCELGQIQDAIQAGLFSSSEAAIAMADLHGRMNSLHRFAKKGGCPVFLYKFSNSTTYMAKSA